VVFLSLLLLPSFARRFHLNSYIFLSRGGVHTPRRTCPATYCIEFAF
jgi:hypothetical protein